METTTYRSAESYLAELVSNPHYLRRFAESESGLAVTRALTNLRKARGVSPEELAERIGRPPSYVAHLEAGAYARCPLPVLRTLARALGYDVDVQGMFHELAAPVYAHDVGLDKFLEEELSVDQVADAGAALSERDDRALHRWEHVVRAAEAGEPIDAVVRATVKGGLLVELNGISGFVPASQLRRQSLGNLDELVGKKLRLKVIDVDHRRRRVVLSQRQLLADELNAKKQELLGTLRAGQIRRGVVVRIADFGAFVDLGGIEGMVHVSEIARERVNHPSNVLTVGSAVTVVVLKVDPDGRKISLSIRAVPDHMAEPADRQSGVVAADVSAVARAVG